ncbi:LacI family DNA-binding transcriptional regulator [Mycoplasmopsis felifaucium]|uniref:LacI family DNA-binding transcriptional regulator n=1 Tax=Mycoplasmopsis felifaucium TaxID=35768 RepID=UPI00048171CA|nr:LacI family DNA-binding transcriptional regulator [Mycoplasmopsis felifaucium]
MKNFSYKDISKLAKVSISTVSRFYNGGYVSKNTKQKIEEIVKEHNYYPNHGARLIRGHDNSIFVIVPEWYDNSCTQVMNGIQQGAKKYNERVIVTFTEPTYENYIETVKYVISWRPRSIVFFLPTNDREKILAYIKENVSDCATLIYNEQNSDFNCVSIDYENSFYSITKKFAEYIEDGQKIILPIDNKLDEHQQEMRKKGFEKAARELGLNYEIAILENKNVKKFKEFLNYLNKENIVNVVASTHEVFINLVSSADKNLRLTDISYVSIYDYQSKYKCKIFIDYPQIGMEITRILNDFIHTGETQSKVFKPLVSFK